MISKYRMVRTLREFRSLLPVLSGNLWHGRWASATVIIGSMLMVGVLMVFLSISHGYAYAARNGGSDSIAVVQWSQATSETTSQILREQVALLRTAALQLGMDEFSPEVATTVSLLREEDLLRLNMTLRGMDMTIGPGLRDGFKVVEGRLPLSGKYELMVGRALAVQHQGFRIGHEIHLINTDWRIVGVFELHGEAFESELWGELVSAQAMYGRADYQSVRLRLNGPDALQQLQALIEDDPRLELNVRTERALYRAEIEDASDLVRYIGWPLSIVLAIGCLAGIFNTMLIAIDGRRFSLRTLFLLGYSPSSIFIMVFIEIIVLCVAGAMLGIVVCWFIFDGMQASTLGKGMVTVKYLLRVDMNAAFQGIALAIIVGLLGGFLPAWRSMKEKVA